MKIKIDEDIYLAQITKEDSFQLVELLNNPKIYKNTLRIPYPYTMKDANWWIGFVNDQKKEIGRLINFAIKDSNDKLIGGIGFNGKYGFNSGKDEIGYWLAEDYWNRGIMTKVVLKICEIGFYELNLETIEATVFDFNDASVKVLEKAGFYFKEYLKDYYNKDGKVINGKSYEINKEEFVKNFRLMEERNSEVL